ncbi:MAG: phosphotransferase [Methanobrevibacter sp.]|nr:phosphotransferase [Methanobrevibacter sp.]
MDNDFEEIFGSIVGKGQQATVYVKDGYAVKLYKEGYSKQNIFSEAFIMANLELLDFPSPKVYEVLYVNGRYGLRMDQAKGKLMSEDISSPEKTQKVIDDLVNLQCHLNDNSGAELEGLTDIKARFHNDIKLNDNLSPETKKKLLNKLDKLPEGHNFCHSDFHYNNVFFDGENYMIIDLLQICRGEPAADVACSFVAYNILNTREIAEYYLNQYCQTSGISKENVWQWIPIYAGAILGQVDEEFTPILEEFIELG